MSIEDELSSIRSQISQVQSKKARAQVEHEQASARLADGRAALLEKFEIHKVEDADSVRKSLEMQLEETLEGVRSRLAEAGA